MSIEPTNHPLITDGDLITALLQLYGIRGSQVLNSRLSLWVVCLVVELFETANVYEKDMIV